MVLYYFKKSERFVVLNIEHKIDKFNKNKEAVVLSDYRDIPFSIENYYNKLFIGFTNNSELQLANSNFKASTRNKTMYEEFEDDLGGGESCYSCINRTYQASVKKCSEDIICDLVCSLNIACKATFALSAIAVCTSPMDRPCSPITRVYE